jgi:hypothetical protein
MAELKRISDFVTEMDTINVLSLNPINFKYADCLTQVMKDVEDPF